MCLGSKFVDGHSAVVIFSVHFRITKLNKRILVNRARLYLSPLSWLFVSSPTNSSKRITTRRFSPGRNRIWSLGPQRHETFLNGRRGGYPAKAQIRVPLQRHAEHAPTADEMQTEFCVSLTCTPQILHRTGWSSLVIHVGDWLE